MKLYLCLVAFNKAHTRFTIDRIGSIFRSMGVSPTSYELLVVDNSNFKAEGECCDDLTSISGTNRFREWSGYREGLEWHCNNDKDIPGILFLNDTCFKYSDLPLILYAYTSMFGCPSKPVVVGRDVILGRFDMPKQEIKILGGHALRGWISSFCFYLSRGLFCELIKIEKSLVSFLLDNRSTKFKDLHENFFDGWPSSGRAHLERWLFNGGWYASADLSEENYGEFRAKLRSIYAEFLLSFHCLKRAGVVSVRGIRDKSGGVL